MITMEIVSRASWGAQVARGFGPAPLPASEVWLHHSVTVAPGSDLSAEKSAMRGLEQIGQDRFGGGVSYTFAVMPSGRIFEGHGVDREGAHTRGRNSIARAIVLIGNYDVNPVTSAQKNAVAALLQHGHAAGWWSRQTLNGGHQQAPGAQTACPGRFGMAAIPEINKLALGESKNNTEDDMSEVAEKLIRELHMVLVSGRGLGDVEAELGTPAQIRRDLGTVRADVKAVSTQLGSLSGSLTEYQAKILAAITADANEQVDVVALAEALREELGEQLVNELVERLSA